MTRFDASDPAERRKLFADAVLAHRERASAFLTIEAEPTAEEEPDDAEDLPEDAPEHTAPWLQFAEKTFNLDCTDAELERLTALLNEYPEFRIDQMEDPEDAHGTNVRVSARSDANRLSQFADDVFRSVYERPEDYQAWVVAI